MNREQAKAAAKPYLKKYVETFAKRDRRAGRNMYACPFCDSGHGGRGSDGAFSIDKPGTYWKCFSCGKSGDIFDLVRYREKLEGADLFKRVYDFCGIEVDSKEDPAPAQEQSPVTDPLKDEPEEEEEPENLLDYYKECKANRKETEYLHQRGISDTLADHFMIGFDKNFNKGTGGKTWEAIIIPTGVSSYTARNTDPEADSRNRIRKHGPALMFNFRALYNTMRPVFITEGEIDALSIIEAGAEAIALGSTANADSFIRELEDQKPAQPLILALDNDDAGRKAEEDLIKKLTALEITFYRTPICGNSKDPNEALMADRQTFIDAVRSASQAAAGEQNVEKNKYLNNRATAHLNELHQEINESAARPLPQTGFPLLDKELDGGMHPGLYLLGAVPSLGKSTIMMQVADQIAQQGFDVLIFSLEMSRVELISKSISRETFINVMQHNGDPKNAKTARGITDGRRYEKYSTVEKSIINQAEETYKEYADHIYIIEGSGDIGTKQIRETVEKHVTFTGKAPLVFVDYLQILAPWDARATDKQNADKAVLELKRISRDFITPVLAVSSFNRDNYNTQAGMTSFKESGGLEYGADVVLGLQAKGAGEKGFNIDQEKKKDPRTLQIKVAKNRNGRTGEIIDFEYYPLFNYFCES